MHANRLIATWDDRCAGCVSEQTSGGLRAVGKCKCGFYAGSGPPNDPGTCDVSLMTFSDAIVETNEAFCTKQAAGNYQLTMVTSGEIRLYDAECLHVATFDINALPDDCSAPLKLHYFEGRDILVTEYNPGPEGLFPGFRFDWDGRSYGMGDAWCDICLFEEGGSGVEGCKCGFYVG